MRPRPPQHLIDFVDTLPDDVLDKLIHRFGALQDLSEPAKKLALAVAEHNRSVDDQTKKIPSIGMIRDHREWFVIRAQCNVYFHSNTAMPGWVLQRGSTEIKMQSGTTPEVLRHISSHSLCEFTLDDFPVLEKNTLLTQVYAAAARGQNADIARILDEDPNLDLTETPWFAPLHDQESLMHLAARNSPMNADGIRILAEQGAAVDLVDQDGNSPLAQAIIRHNDNAVILADALIDAGAEMIYPKGEGLVTSPFYEAVLRRSGKVASLMIERQVPTEQFNGEQIENLFNLACANGMYDVVHHFLKKGVSPLMPGNDNRIRQSTNEDVRDLLMSWRDSQRMIQEDPDLLKRERPDNGPAL